MNAQEINQYQVGGTHYKKGKDGVDAWTCIDTLFSPSYQEGFYVGNAIKYIIRAGSKDPELQDLQKASHYLLKSMEVVKDRSQVGAQPFDVLLDGYTHGLLPEQRIPILKFKALEYIFLGLLDKALEMVNLAIADIEKLEDLA